MVETIVAAIRIARAYATERGLRATVKMIAKVATPSRSYYAVLCEGRILSDGWITAGKCRLYTIGAQDRVIGPIETHERERGRGLAHASLTRAANHCLRQGAEWVYIDTTQSNVASQKTILKSGMRPA